MKILGTTKVSSHWRITLIDAVKEKLKAEEGDIIVFFLNDNGEIVIKKG